MSNINDKDLKELEKLAKNKTYEEKGFHPRTAEVLLARFLVNQQKVNKAIIEELEIMKEAHNTLVSDLELILAKMEGRVAEESKIIKV